MKKILAVVSVVALTVCLSPLTLTVAADDWVYLGNAHVDGQHDHDTISVGTDQGRFDRLMIKVLNAPIEFDRVVVNYGNGTSETLAIRSVIPAGGQTRAIKLARGDRYVVSLDVGYGKANPGSAQPEIQLYGRKS
jgi:hypothetical protein